MSEYIPDMKGETWKDVQGYEGYYQVSDAGRVSSLGRTVISGDNRRFLKSKLKKPSLNKGYPSVRLYKNGTPTNFLVHSLVARNFIGPYPEGKQINHIDENKTNNNLSNLEYVTPSENMNHGTRNERAGRTKGTPVISISPTGKVTEYESMSDAERKTNGRFEHSAISRVCRGLWKEYKGYTWEYKEVKK